MQRVKDMLGDLNQMLEADARGEHTQADFDRFMEQPRRAVPGPAGNLEELVDSLVRRMAAAERLLRSLSRRTARRARRADGAGARRRRPGGRDGQAADALRARRPDLDWAARPASVRCPARSRSDSATPPRRWPSSPTWPSWRRRSARTTRARAWTTSTRRRSGGPSGRQAVDDVEALRRIERELERQGYLTRNAGQLELTPKAVRRLGDTALRRVFADLSFGRSGDHDLRDAGPGGRADRQHPSLGVRRRAAARRPGHGTQRAPAHRPAGARRRGSPTAVRDGVVPGAARPASARFRGGRDRAAQRRRRCRCLSTCPTRWQLRGTWAAAKQTALALHALLRSRFPQDALQVVGFSNYARELHETELAGLGWDMVQGTNLHHALLLAGRHLDRHPEHEPMVLIVTDGEPTAHLQRDGRSWFDWPPSPETVELTLAEVDKMTRRHAALNIFMLADDARLTAFVDNVARRNGGTGAAGGARTLGEYVVRDFLRTRGVSRR